jgi:hypothetical protein
MTVYDINKTFDVLKKYKITSNKESVRRWLRKGVIKGIKPTSRKEGWKVREEDLFEFIKERVPSFDAFLELEGEDFNTTSVVNSNTTNVVKEDPRAEMWWECVRKNIFEGYITIKKTRIRECIQHKGYSKDLEEKVWKMCEENKRGYSHPRVPYLLEAFLFDGQRILMDENFEDLEEKIYFPLIEYVRNKYIRKIDK